MLVSTSKMLRLYALMALAIRNTEAFTVPLTVKSIHGGWTTSSAMLSKCGTYKVNSPLGISSFSSLSSSSSSSRPRSSHEKRKAIAIGMTMTSSPTSLSHDIAPEKPSVGTSIASTMALIALDIAFRRLLKALSISFPSALAGCGTLFTTMVALYALKPALGDSLYSIFAPGSAVLAKWLPVFFVPSLVTLPLAQSLGSSIELLKIAAVIVLGFFFTLFSTAFSVLGVRKMNGSDRDIDSSGNGIDNSNENDNDSTHDEDDANPSDLKEIIQSKTSSKPFSDRTFNGLSVSAIASAIASILAINYTQLPAVVTTPLRAITMLFITLSTFTFGARLPKSFSKKVHPLITCTALTWTSMSFFAKLTRTSFRDLLTSYKVSSMCPIHLGAGDVLLFMLGPAVVALACQMYDRKKLMKENILEVGTAVGVSSVGGLFGTAFLVNLLQVTSPILRKCALSRNITSPLAMAIAGILGADISLAVSMVVVTGLIGANFGAAILDAAGIKDAVARGMGIGAAAHGLGTAAFANEEDAFPFAAISMALTASACTILVSVPVVKKLLLKIALGA